MRQRISKVLLTICLVLLTTELKAEEYLTEAPPAELAMKLNASLGTQLDRTDSKASISLEPTISYRIDRRRSLEFYTLLNQPLSRYENLTLPKTVFSFDQGFDWISGLNTTLTTAVSALALDRWTRDGHIIRGSVALTASAEVLRGLTLALKIGPYAQTNRYRQTTEGKDLARYGLQEKFTVEYQLGPVIFDLVLLLDQKYSTTWKNSYSTRQLVAVKVDETFSLGIIHDLVGTGAVDDSTGFFQPVQLFNERNSRVSAFVEYQL